MYYYPLRFAFKDKRDMCNEKFDHEEMDIEGYSREIS